MPEDDIKNIADQWVFIKHIIDKKTEELKNLKKVLKDKSFACDRSEKNKNKPKMGPRNLIMEEIEDWNNTLLYKDIK